TVMRFWGLMNTSMSMMFLSLSGQVLLQNFCLMNICLSRLIILLRMAGCSLLNRTVRNTILYWRRFKMLSLLYDTSNRPLSVALNLDGFTLSEINTTVKKTHSATVMDYIDKLFKMADMKKNDIGRIIVAKGPGSYTGVRIGVT